jgi:hypothetical protein
MLRYNYVSATMWVTMRRAMLMVASVAFGFTRYLLGPTSCTLAEGPRRKAKMLRRLRELFQASKARCTVVATVMRILTAY